MWLIRIPRAGADCLERRFVTKLFGKRYILTNRNLQVRQMIGVRTFGQASLADIKDVIIRELPGQAFYKAVLHPCPN